MACKSFLELIATNKRDADEGINLFPTSEGAKATNIQYALGDAFEFADPYDRPTKILASKDPLIIGEQYLNDIYPLNIVVPTTFQLTDISFNDISLVNMPGIDDISEAIYQDAIKCNFYANRNYDLIDLESCSPYKEQEANYLEYVRRLQNNGSIFDVFAIFTGRKESDTPIGIVGAKALQEHFQRNIEGNVIQTASQYLETDPYRFIQRDSIFRLPYDITVPKSTIGKFALFLEKITGAYSPFSYLPPDVFDLSRKSNLSKSEKTALLLEYTGKGQQQELLKLSQQNLYYPQFQSDALKTTENIYVDYDVDGKTINASHLNAEYSKGVEDIVILDKMGKKTRSFPSINKYFNPHYNIISIQKNSDNVELFSPSTNLNLGEDEILDNTTWNKATPNNFNNKSLLYKTKELVNNSNNIDDFIDSTRTEFGKYENDEYITISKGDAVTAYGNWGSDEDGLDYQINKGDFFRVWTKNRKYSKLNRTIFHKTLDRNDKRSVLNENGLVNFAPTYRVSKDQSIKNYMFSIENLAWADNIADLPECEIGNGDPISGNKGRIMWFPPYDLSFNESSSPSWNEHSFIGRGEPIYTYNNTKRSGTLSFTMIVDHPSIVNKLRGERTELWERYFKGDKSVNSLIDSIDKRKFTSDEIAQLEKIRNRNSRPPKITNEKILTPNQKDANEIENNVESINDEQIKFISVYFPNNVDRIPSLNGSISDNRAYQSKYQTNYLDYTYYKGVKRDLTFELKTGRPAYPNRTNYELNNDFFDDDYIGIRLIEIFDALNERKAKKIYFTFLGYASQPDPADTSNIVLSENRARNLKIWFDAKLSKFRANNDIGDVEIDTNTVLGLSDFLSVGTDSDVEQDSRNVVEARRAEIVVEFDLEPEPDVEDDSKLNDVVDGENLNQDVNLVSDNLGLENISPSIIEKLFGINECDMFEYMEKNDPFLYNTISEKIKFFHPAFHSMTPEGFNSRLNFLHQCTRQGENIGVDGIDYLTNFAFGRPPVCILRIGDFYYTKIIIESLSIEYEQPKWDLNPQGFVAPMIAKVSISFNFIGGQSMSGPLNRLQNALSFNYYSSLELFDARADSIVKDNNNNDVQIVDGVKLSKLVNPKTISDNKVLNDKKANGTNVDPKQKITNVVAPLPTNVEPPISINTVPDLISIKSLLGLNLTETEKAIVN